MSSSKKRLKEEKKGENVKLRTNKDPVSQKQRHHCGLINQGATCYLSSVLQVLFVSSELHNRLDPRPNSTDQHLRSIFDNLKETPCETKNLTKSLRIENVNQQHDAAECLELILRNVSPQVSQAFKGQLTYTTKCSKDHIVIEETNPFWILPLSLGEKHDATYSVEKGFESYFQPKSHSGDNKVYCNDCKTKTMAASECEMVGFPAILTLHLKRFDFDYKNMSRFKSECRVDIPCTLQVKNKKYALYGIVNHIGSLRGGRYTATVLSKEDKTWYDCDDTYVEKMEEQPFADSRTYKSRTAYLLVYRASESTSDEATEQLTEQRSKEESSPRPLTSRFDFLKMSSLISLAVLGSVLIVILPVVLTSVNKN